jgi:hypothetical protein
MASGQAMVRSRLRNALRWACRIDRRDEERCPHRIAAQVLNLSRGDEHEALTWIESVSEFDAPDRR